MRPNLVLAACAGLMAFVAAMPWLSAAQSGSAQLTAAKRPDGKKSAVMSERIKTKLKRGPKRFDQPKEAAQFANAKRAPAGETAVPMDRYVKAIDHLKVMNTYSVSQARSGAPSTDLTAPELTGWSFLGPGNVGGRVRSIVIDPSNPSIIYAAGASGGVWKTTDGGTSWAAVGDLLPNLAVTTMVMDPANSSVIYAGTGEGFYNIDAQRGAGIFKTTNAGGSWTALASTSSSPDFRYVNKLVVSPVNNSRLYAATGTGLWRSLDAGSNWTRVISYSSGCHDLAVRTDQPTDYVFAACGNFEQATVYRNSDAAGAGTWTSVLTEARMGRTSLALARSNQNTIYALSASIETNSYQNGLYAVFRSTSSGDANTWSARVRNTSATRLNTLLLSNTLFGLLSTCFPGNANQLYNQGWYDNIIAVDPVNPDIVWAGGIDLFRSNDGGANWGQASHWQSQPPSAHADQHAIAFHPQYNGTTNQIAYFGNDGGVYRTSNARATVATGNTAPCNATNSAVTWTSLNNGLGITQFYHGLPYPNGTTFFGGTQDNGTQRGTSGAPNGWARIQGGDGGYVAVDSSNTNVIYAEYTGLSIQKSVNGGTLFADAVTGIEDGGFPFISVFTMDPNTPSRLWTGGGFLWRTVNSAASWSRASAALNGSVSAIAVAPGNSNRVAAGTNRGNIYVNTAALGAGSTTVWTSRLPRSGYVSSVAYDPSNNDTIYVTYSSFNSLASDAHVYRSTDGGLTWNPADGSGVNSIPDIPAHSIVVDPQSPSRLFLGTDLGVFVSVNAGQSWSREITGFAPVATESLTVQNIGGTYSLWAFTHGRGAWRSPIAAPSGCSYILSPQSHTATTAGGASSFGVTAPAGCAWTASPEANWIPVSGGSSGTGNGTVNFSVAANSGVARTSGIAVGAAGVTSRFVITQAGIGGTNDEPSGATVISALPYNTTQNTATATANPADPLHTCTAGADSRSVWYRITPAFTGILAANTAGSNYDTVLAAYAGSTSPGAQLACNDDSGSTLQSAVTFNVTSGQSYLVRISAYGSANPGGTLVLSASQSGACAVTVNPTSQTFGSLGGSDSLAVTAPGCAWTAVTAENWITILSGAAGTGNGTVQYSVATNVSGNTRSGRISVGAAELRIEQNATCAYTLSSAAQGYSSAGGAGTVTVTTLGLCTWTAATSTPWITVTGGANSTGSGQVTYTVAANNTGSSRAGSVTIAGQTHSVTQAAAGLANDESAGASVVSSLPFFTSQSTTAASTAASDPNQSCGSPVALKNSKSVWFRFNPATSGTARFDTVGSGYDTVVTAYRNTPTAANEIACNDDGNALQSVVTFGFTAGTAYYIEVTAYGTGLGGTLQFRGSLLTNDEPVAATIIGSLPFTNSQETGAATLAAADPVHACTAQTDSATVWYRYTASFTGIVNFNTFGSGYDTVIAVYPAASVVAGSELGCDDDALEGLQSQISLAVTSGQTYLIQISSFGVGTGGSLVISAARLENDETAGAITVPALPYSATEDVRAATRAASDPAPSCAVSPGYRTVWFRYVAPFTGAVTFDTAGSDYDTIVTAYSGTPATNTQIACSDDVGDVFQGRIGFSANGGSTYYIAVSGYDPTPDFNASLLLTAESQNVAAAAITAPASGSVLGSTSVTFNWTPGTGVTAYRLTLGSSIGASDLYNGAQIGTLSAAVSGLPADGRTIHARLHSILGTATLTVDHTYTAFSSVTAASGTPQQATTGSAFLLPLRVLVRNGAGTPVANTAVTFAAPSSGASASLSASQAQTGADGIASVSATANATAGPYEITATAAGFSGTARFALTNLAQGNLPAPSFITPSGTVTTTIIGFQWTQVSGANRYELRVIESNTPQQFRVEVLGAASTNAIYTLPSGNYRAEVSACNNSGCSSPGVRNFIIAGGTVPATAPTGVACLTASDNGQNRLNCNWNALAGAHFYFVNVVQPNAGPGGGALTVAGQQVGTNSMSVLIPNGSATVLVRGCTGDGCGPFSAGAGVNPTAGDPSVPILGEPFGGSSFDAGANAPNITFSWNRVAGDTGGNFRYRLYVQDFSRNQAALDVLTTNNFYGAYFNPGTRYDALVIAIPIGGGTQRQGPPNPFLTRGRVPKSPVITQPAYSSTVSRDGQGQVTAAWTPLVNNDGTVSLRNYQYFFTGPSQLSGITTATSVPLTLAPGNWQGIVRACNTGTTCTANSGGWGPWNNEAGSEGGMASFNVQ